MFELRITTVFPCCVGILFILSPFGFTKDLYEFKVNRMTVEDCDPRIIYNCSFSTDIVSRTVKSHNIIAYVQLNVSFNAIFVKVNYYRKVRNVFRQPLVSMEEDHCGFLAGTSKSMLIKILWPFLKKQSNLKDKCPYERLINVTGLVFHDAFLPPALPEGEARIDIHVRNGPQRLSIMKVKFFIEIKPKGAIRLDFK